MGRNSEFYDDGPAARHAAASGSNHQPTRAVDKEKTEAELSVNIKKATSPEETAPKQKHVRKCIVYTWDYHSSLSVWNGLRTQPILADEIQAFKALIVVHKLLQEGHPVTIKEAHGQTGWIETCGRTVPDGGRGYGPLIKAYTTFLLAKLRFHRHHPEFNGLFEYEEYISLKNIDDPNEGYETITDLMTLQDQIDAFQKLITNSLRGNNNNECRISALVPLVKESFGIYKFITSMLRAMHRRTDAIDALLPLRERYNAQHYNLRRFYYECSTIKYLTGLINVPKLGQEPPNLLDSGEAPSLPERPSAAPTRKIEEAPRVDTPTATQGEIEEQRRMLEEYERKQQALVSQRESEQRRQEDEKRRQDAEYAEMQQQQQERERLAQEQLLRDQMNAQWNQQQQGQAAQLEREILAMRGQYERDQMLLEQYDRRVKSLESELGLIGANVGAQMSAKDELIAQLQQQIEIWRSKYEALAKLYSQLRSEHLDLLNKSKGFQLKAGSAQEAVDKMERMERDVKAKNLELADMIRERDRARYDVDRLKASHKEEIERLKRDLAFANERAEDAGRNMSSEVSGIMQKYNRQLNDLEATVKTKQDRIDDLLHRLDAKEGDYASALEEKQTELLILQEAMDATIKEMGDLRLNQNETTATFDSQVDTLILDHRKELNAIIDSILQACVQKVDDAIYELEAPMQTGNTSATPEYTLSIIEKAQTNANEFASVFNSYLGKKSGHVDVIKAANEFAQALSETLVSTKGLTRLVEAEDSADKLVRVAKMSGDVGQRFFLNLQSFRLVAGGKNDEIALRNNAEVRNALAKLSETIETVIPKRTSAGLGRANGDLGDLVSNEMQNAARAIEEATARIQTLMSRPKDGKYAALDIQVHDAILEATMAITSAIGRLIQAATESQEEIVREGKGSSTTQQFYKRNNRWTEGLISAAKAVARATTLLIEAADGVISGSHSLEQLIVASNEVSAATAQLVAASRVKASLMSRTQQRLELAAKAVTDACRALVKQVKLVSNQQADDGDAVDYKAMSSHEFKKREMEQQVEILTLEKDLGAARRRLGEMRRAGYHQDAD